MSLQAILKIDAGKAAHRRPEVLGVAIATLALICHSRDGEQEKISQSHATCNSSHMYQCRGGSKLASSDCARAPDNMTIDKAKYSMNCHPLATTPNDNSTYDMTLKVRPPSWIRRNLLASIGIALPLPRLLTPNDPTMTLSPRHRQRRLRDENHMRQLLEQASKVSNDPDAIRKIQQELCDVAYGVGVTPQAREDFLARYGCTGWTDNVLEAVVDLCESRGMVEIGAGHGQWARALSETYESRHSDTNESTAGKLDKKKKKFDFCLAYDDMSNLPLNTHIYNPYTKPHHDYFGTVRKLERHNLPRLLQSWSCRGRVLLLVYPPQGGMAIDIVQHYVNGAPENDTIIFVGEGRGGANGSDELFDFFENGQWVLLNVMDVQRPPGDKGYEKMFILQRADQR